MASYKKGHYKNVFLYLQYYLLPSVYWGNYWANMCDYVTDKMLKLAWITE